MVQLPDNKVCGGTGGMPQELHILAMRIFVGNVLLAVRAQSCSPHQNARAVRFPRVSLIERANVSDLFVILLQVHYLDTDVHYEGGHLFLTPLVGIMPEPRLQ